MLENHGKTWMEIEIEESFDLFRKRLEELNHTDEEDVDHETVCEIRDIYEALHLMMQIAKEMPPSAK